MNRRRSLSNRLRSTPDPEAFVDLWTESIEANLKRRQLLRPAQFRVQAADGRDPGGPPPPRNGDTVFPL